jgi:hypothetical protein
VGKKEERAPPEMAGTTGDIIRPESEGIGDTLIEKSASIQKGVVQAVRTHKTLAIALGVVLGTIVVYSVLVMCGVLPDPYVWLHEASEVISESAERAGQYWRGETGSRSSPPASSGPAPADVTLGTMVASGMHLPGQLSQTEYATLGEAAAVASRHGAFGGGGGGGGHGALGGDDDDDAQLASARIPAAVSQRNKIQYDPIRGDGVSGDTLAPSQLVMNQSAEKQNHNLHGRPKGNRHFQLGAPL